MKLIQSEIDSLDKANIEVIPTIDTNSIVDEFQYGKSIPKLTDFNVSTSSSGNYKIGQFTITSTGNIVITGIGFKPKLVTYTYTSGSSMGLGQMTSTTQTATHDLVSSSSYCITCFDSGGTLKANASYVSMDTDGFTINVGTYTGASFVSYTCFG